MRRSKTKVKHNGGIKSPLTPKMIVSRFFHRDLYSGRSYSQYCQQSMDQPRKSLARRQLNRGIWSNETGSAVPSCASLLVLPAQAKSVFYSQDSSRFPRRRPHIPLTAIGFKSQIYRVKQMRTDGVHCREHTGTGPVFPKAVPGTGAAFSGFTMSRLFVRLSFFTPTIGIQ